MPQIRLLATDYDDTLVPRVGRRGHLTGFKVCLNDLRLTSGTKWAIVTGRDFHSLHLILKQSQFRGLRPDFILVSESYIFRWTKWGYLPDLKWNFKVWLKRKQVQKCIKGHLDYWQKEIFLRWPNCKALNSSYASLWYKFKSKDDAVAAEQFLKSEISDLPQLQIFRSSSDLYMGVTYCGKGDALNELCRKYNFSLANTLAIGDGTNDISMLNGSSAKMVACVANACPELKAVVEKVGGYQAQKNDADGVVESINHFLDK